MQLCAQTPTQVNPLNPSQIKSTYKHKTHLSVTPEGRQTRQQDVEDDTQTPHVGFVAVVLTQHLWGDVVRGTDLQMMRMSV